MIDDEALRRRLYRPGADDGDVEAYLATVAPAAASAEPAPVPPRPGGSRQRWRRWAAVLVAVAVLVVGGRAAALLLAPADPARAAAPLPTRLPDPGTSARFVAALDRGDDAGLGAWWADGTPYLEAHGVGDGTVSLPVSASGRGGRLVVLLVLDRDATAGWATARLVIHDDRTIHLRTEASATGSVSAGVPAVGRVVYAAEHRPLRLLVRAPAHARWGVAAVFAA